MTDQEKAFAVERASAYRDMQNSWAFKDLMMRIEAEKNSQMDKLMDQVGADNLERTKGFRACVEFIKGELSFVTEFKK